MVTAVTVTVLCVLRYDTPEPRDSLSKSCYNLRAYTAFTTIYTTNTGKTVKENSETRKENPQRSCDLLIY